MTPPVETVARIARALAGRRFDLADEARLQAQVSAALAAGRIRHAREARLDAGRIDMLAGAVGIEIKVRGAKRQIYRQCKRYARDPRVRHLVVLTAAAVSLPPKIGDTPCTVLSLGRA